MKQRIRISFFILLFLVSFIPSIESQIRQIDKQLIPFPTVMETVKSGKISSLNNNGERTWLSAAHYSFWYIGELTDTIILKHEVRFPKKYYLDWRAPRDYAYGPEIDVEIRLDTTKQINNSYAVLLTNTTKNTIMVGYGNTLPLILEAKDSTGAWKPIEEKFTYMCGVGIEMILLPPKEVVLSLMPVTRGDFSTELRLAYGKNHSSSFRGIIHYRQFESRFDKKGEFREEYKQELEKRGK